MLNGDTAKQAASKLRFWSDSREAYTDGLIRIEWTDAQGVTHSTMGRYYADDNCVTWDYAEPKSARIYNLAAECAGVAGDLADPVGAEFMGWQTREQMEQAVENCCCECGAVQESTDALSDRGECTKCFVARIAKEAA